MLVDIHHCSSSKTSKVPTSTNALVELMNMVERWRQRTDYGPVVVVSQDGISRQSSSSSSSSSSSWSCSSSWWWPWHFLGVGFTAPQTPALSRSQLFNWCHLYCYWTLNRSQLSYLYHYHLYNFCYMCLRWHIIQFNCNLRPSPLKVIQHGEVDVFQVRICQHHLKESI